MAKKKSEEYAGDSGDDGDYAEEPNFEDPDGFVDDISDEGKWRLPAKQQHARLHSQKRKNSL